MTKAQYLLLVGVSVACGCLGALPPDEHNLTEPPADPGIAIAANQNATTGIPEDNTAGTITTTTTTTTSTAPPTASTTLFVAPAHGDLYVAPTGNDSNPGTQAKPFLTISAAAKVSVPGDIVVIAAGTYREQLNLTRSGTAAKPITFWAESLGTVIVDAQDATGKAVRSQLLGGTAQYITVKGITFRHGTNGFQQAIVVAGTGWDIEDSVAELSGGEGFQVRNAANVIFLRLLAQDNDEQGITGGYATSTLIKDCVSRRNNANSTFNPENEGGGGKFAQCDGVTVDNYESYDNVGPGLWFDYNNKNITVKNSNLHDNIGGKWPAYMGMGLMIEISQGPVVVENNYFHGNSGDGMGVGESTNITITNNLFVNDSIGLRDETTRGIRLNNVSVTNNRFKDSYSWGGWAATATQTLRQLNEQKEVVFDSNIYDNASGDTLIYWVKTGYNTLATIRTDLGFETHGSAGTITVP